MRSMRAGVAAAMTCLAVVLMSPLALAGTVTGSATGPGSVVVNEFAPRGPFGSIDEFVELRNTGEHLVVLDGWGLVACLSLGTSIIITFGPTDVIDSGGYLFVAHVGHADGDGRGSDAVYAFDVPDDGGWLLYDSWSGYADGVGLASGLDCTEGDPASECDWAAGEALTRDGRGTDTDDNLTDLTCESRSSGF